MTGALNQRGEVRAVGGVTGKWRAPSGAWLHRLA